MKDSTKDTSAKIAVIVMLLGLIGLMAVSSHLSSENKKAHAKLLAEATSKQKECEKCERLAERLNKKERSYDTFLHQVVIDGTDYFVSETRHEDNGEQKYVVSRGRRQWVLTSSNPDETFIFLVKHGDPKVEQDKEYGLVRICTEQGKHIATLSRHSEFMLRTDVEWERVVDEVEKQAAIDAIEE